MIAENELRIGNWVEHDDSWCYRGEDVTVFQWETSDWYALGECTLFLESIKPIPLTEEWLVKFGFEWSVRHQAYKKARFVYVIDFYKEHPQYENSACFLNREHRSGDCLVCLEYVHQLQNLYFALTGQELTLKQ